MSSSSEFNYGVRAWTMKTQGKALDNMMNMGVRRTGTLFRKLRSRVKKGWGSDEIELIQYTMPRYGFVQQSEGGKGSRRVEPGKWGRKYGLVGGTPRPFLLDPIEERMDDLADFVANQMADRNVDHTRLSVKLRE